MNGSALDVTKQDGRVRSKPRKPGGPPKRKPKEGERVALSLRMSPELKRQLDAAAELGGRSQSQEAEFRLERSFDRSDLVSEVLSLAYGKELAGILMLLGDVLVLAECAHPKTRARTWGVHRVDYDEVVQGAIAVLRAFRPRELPPALDRLWPVVPLGFGAKVADSLIKAVRGDPDALGGTDETTIRALLGPIVDRLKDYRGIEQMSQNTDEGGLAPAAPIEHKKEGKRRGRRGEGPAHD